MVSERRGEYLAMAAADSWRVRHSHRSAEHFTSIGRQTMNCVEWICVASARPQTLRRRFMMSRTEMTISRRCLLFFQSFRLYVFRSIWPRSCFNNTIAPLADYASVSVCARALHKIIYQYVGNVQIAFVWHKVIQTKNMKRRTQMSMCCAQWFKTL